MKWVCSYFHCIYYRQECPMQHGKCAYCDKGMEGVKA